MTDKAGGPDIDTGASAPGVSNGGLPASPDPSNGILAHDAGSGSRFQRGDALRNGRYKIRRLLRAAPTKEVYLADDLTLDCAVALDVFSSNAVMPSGLTASEWETRVLGRLGDHPNIATVLDYWENDEVALQERAPLGDDRSCSGH